MTSCSIPEHPSRPFLDQTLCEHSGALGGRADKLALRCNTQYRSIEVHFSTIKSSPRSSSNMMRGAISPRARICSASLEFGRSLTFGRVGCARLTRQNSAPTLWSQYVHLCWRGAAHWSVFFINWRACHPVFLRWSIANSCWTLTVSLSALVLFFLPDEVLSEEIPPPIIRQIFG